MDDYALNQNIRNTTMIDDKKPMMRKSMVRGMKRLSCNMPFSSM
jgi:hypothetical protein